MPLSIVTLAGIPRDGHLPTILYGYGSYGVSLEPTFMPFFLPWVERGGVLAFAHVRGGGELGADWHTEGQKLKKLNTILDFLACGQHLVDAGYTDPHHLAAMGGSAGGITVGRAMEVRPDLFGVVIDDSGMADTLRTETEPNGPPNTVEFGSVKTRDGFRGLYAMSPYLHVRDGVRYPAVLLCAGANDPRVAPWHSAKMAARLQPSPRSVSRRLQRWPRRHRCRRLPAAVPHRRPDGLRPLADGGTRVQLGAIAGLIRPAGYIRARVPGVRSGAWVLWCGEAVG